MTSPTLTRDPVYGEFGEVVIGEWGRYRVVVSVRLVEPRGQAVSGAHLAPQHTIYDSVFGKARVGDRGRVELILCRTKDRKRETKRENRGGRNQTLLPTTRDEESYYPPSFTTTVQDLLYPLSMLKS